MQDSIKNFARALRLPFATASVLPFIFGSLIALPNFKIFAFLLGLMAALSTHLSANLLNDYADSKSGADWKDKRFYTFFGGSKLIQEKVFSEEFYRNLSILFAFIAFSCVITLSFALESLWVIVYYLIILFLGWSYSAKPFQLSYHRLGEVVIFILFGPALVMGGYFVQTRVFPTLDGFILSLPFGFLTTAILYANEIPDFPDDQKAHKHTLVGLIGQEKAYVIYDILTSCGFLSILIAIFRGYLSNISFLSLLCIFFTFKSTKILRNHFSDKVKLIESSKMTIAVHTLVSLVLIADAII